MGDPRSQEPSGSFEGSAENEVRDEAAKMGRSGHLASGRRKAERRHRHFVRDERDGGAVSRSEAGFRRGAELDRRTVDRA